MAEPPKIRLNTDEEEAEIQRQIAADPDTWSAPPDAPILRRGRPAGQTKSQVTLRLDNDVLAALKGEDPKGWQTRANAMLRKAVGLTTPSR